MFSGAAVRYRFYTRWGVTAQELSRIVFSYSVTFWLGLLALGGVSLVASPLPGAHELPAHELVAPVGWLLLLACAAYLVAIVVRREPIRVWEVRAAAAVPADRLRPARRLRAGLGARRRGALRAAAAEQPVVPGPAGGLPRGSAPRARQPRAGRRRRLRRLDGPSAQALPRRPGSCCRRWSSTAWSTTCCRWPWRSGPGRRRAALARRARRARGRVPRPAQRGAHAAGARRLHLGGRGPSLLGRHSGRAGPPPARRLLPLGVIEASHFLGSIAGAGLLLVSQGLARRLDAAYYLAVVGIATGIVSSLLQGGAT